ncbi:hypothetical protein TIFTF001_013280 [Ficus carica]|uniref:Uncharacterized protein n=1 Tax=Ficus carica TaxID=3494 RepID=A0AA88APP1_FICCA|nr:hypothetical protein TIFTF001_013280 [Ficus carica]
MWNNYEVEQSVGVYNLTMQLLVLQSPVHNAALSTSFGICLKGDYKALEVLPQISFKHS